MMSNFHFHPTVSKGTKYIPARDDEVFLLDSAFPNDFLIVGPRWSLRKSNEQILVRGSTEVSVLPQQVIDACPYERYIITLRPSLVDNPLDCHIIIEVNLHRKYPVNAPEVSILHHNSFSDYHASQLRDLVKREFERRAAANKTATDPECFIYSVLVEVVQPHLQSVYQQLLDENREYENLGSLKTKPAGLASPTHVPAAVSDASLRLSTSTDAR